MNNLNDFYEAFINTVVEDKEYGSMYFSRPVLPFQENFFKAAYEFSQEINDSFEIWDDFNKTYLVSCINPETHQFLAFIKFSYNIWLDAFGVDTYLHPNTSYRELKRIGILFCKLCCKAAFLNGKKSGGFFSNFASNYLLKQMCPNLVPDYKQDIVSHSIYDRYTVVYFNLNEKDIQHISRGLVCYRKKDPKIALQTCFNSFSALYGYEKNTNFLTNISQDSKFFYKENDVGVIQGYYSITTKQFSRSDYELGLEIYPYEITKRFSFLEQVLQDFKNFYILPQYKHFECVTSSKAEANLIEKYLNTKTYKITDNYFICHKQLN